MSFTLHPTLAQDCLTIGDLPLCRLLLMNNRHFPWLILTPKRDGMREWFDLPPDEQQQLMREVSATARWLAAHTGADKMNIAALGNLVPQLHVHVIARFASDKAWPKPVWGSASEPYAPEEARRMMEACGQAMNITKM